MTEILPNAEGKAADIQRALLDFYGVLIKPLSREIKDTIFPEPDKKSPQEKSQPARNIDKKDNNIDPNTASSLPPELTVAELTVDEKKTIQGSDSLLTPELEENKTIQVSEPPLPPELSEENQADNLPLENQKVKFQIFQGGRLLYSKVVDENTLPEVDLLSERQANQLELLKLMPEGVTVKEFADWKINLKTIGENPIEERTVFATDRDGLIITNVNASSTSFNLKNDQNQPPKNSSEILDSRYEKFPKSETTPDLEDINLIVNSTENIKRSVDLTPENEIVDQPEYISLGTENNQLIKVKAEEIKGYIKFYVDQELKSQENQVVDYLKQRKNNSRKPNLVVNLIDKFTQKLTNLVETVNNVIEQKVNELDLTYKLQYLFNSKDRKSTAYVFSAPNSETELFIYQDTRGNLRLQDKSRQLLDLNSYSDEKRENILERIDREISLARKRQISQPSGLSSSYRKTR